MANKVYAYYPGCSLDGGAREYDLSLRRVLEVLGVELRELDDWSCCGTTPAHTVDHIFSSALAARNLAIARRMGIETLLVPCPACLIALKKADYYMADRTFRERVNALLEEPYEGGIEIKSALQVLYEEVGTERIEALVRYLFPDLKIAPYYGCLYTRPPKIARFDDPENPTSMDEILKACGFQVCEFEFKTECCGAAFGLVKEEMVNRLSGKILSAAKECGANAVATACPLCQQNLDLRQAQIERLEGKPFRLPVFYFSQLLGLSFGLSESELGIEKLVVDGGGLLSSRRQKAA